MIKSLLIVVWVLGFCKLSAQQPPGDVLPADRTGLQKIHLATDKVIYTPNEQLWFAAYLFEHTGKIRDTADVVTVGLYDPVTDHMVALKKFPIQNRIATGNILLPDTLVAGNYSLVAYTNLVNRQQVPIGTAFKPLRIYAKTGEKAFTTSLTILDSLCTSNKIAILHQVIPEDYQVIFNNTRCRYQTSGDKLRNLDLDDNGTGIIYINPKNIRTTNRSLSTTTIYRGDTVKSRIRIPESFIRSSDWAASFFPEGGALVAGYTNRVFWELTHKNVVISSPALLLEDGEVIDTIQTTANGAAHFYVNAKAGKQYAVVAGLTKESGSQFPLPAVVADGLRFELPKLVVNDSLTFELWSAQKRNLKVMIKEATGLYTIYHFNIGSYKKLTLLLNDFARGLCEVWITDEQDNLLARSYFFAHYNNRNQLHLATNKDLFKTRDSVALKVSVTTQNGTPLQAMATLSCALLSRIDLPRAKNIESDHDLGSIAYNESVFLKQQNIMGNSALLEHIIRMKKTEPMDTSLKGDPSPPFQKPGVQLQLARFGKREKKSMELVLFRESDFSFLKTNNEGLLSLSTGDLLVNDGRKLFVKGMGKKNGDYYVQTEDALTRVHSNIRVPRYQPVYREQAPDLKVLLKTDKSEKFSSTLETVVVKSKTDYGAMGRTNPCGDYVCQYNILNCPNHTVPYKWPVKGERYRSFSGEFVYQGCDYENNMYIPSASLVYRPRTFLGMDSTLLKQDFPEHLSTLWWQPFKWLKKEEPTALSFHTSDQKGTYLITVQGFAENGQPFYGEKLIRVEE